MKRASAEPDEPDISRASRVQRGVATATHHLDENRFDENGFTLVDVLLTLIIMSTAVLALIAAMFTLVLGSDVSRKTSEVSSIAVTWGESIVDFDFPYQECADAATYQAAYDAWADRFTFANFYSAEIRDVDYWDRDAVAPDDGAFVESCTLGDDGAQEFDLLVTASDGKGSASLTVVKQDPSANGA